MDIADRLQHIAKSTENRSVQKLIKLMSPLLVENAKGLERPRLHFANPLWTNNNCESLNHCLKQALSWRSLKLVELVQKLHSNIKTQHREVQGAICGRGEFVLLMNIRGYLMLSHDISCYPLISHLTQFYSDIGGALGLWMGLSVIAVLEVLHFLTSLLRLFATFLAVHVGNLWKLLCSEKSSTVPMRS
ncbi:hypothetical protein PoB_004556100 [Plakobranchus ocellatus]|uniref:Uncharacterized protein n=1 Tax=Plakobranchus ocellatus TaxID=259542 RepID=A0AAV4BF49_9GAST|nr:hypothetical protein PoB_004556100 [Plakobranchus ocellatus]